MGNEKEQEISQMQVMLWRGEKKKKEKSSEHFDTARLCLM